MNYFGFYFKDNYYILVTEAKNKTDRVINVFMDYFKHVLGYPEAIVNNSKNILKNSIEKIDYSLSDNWDWYFIHSKYSGTSISAENVIFIEE